MEYCTYWGLSSSPFSLSPDPSRLYMSKQHFECFLRLQYAIESNKGGALLISENAGDGKTTVLRKLVTDLQGGDESDSRVAFITHPTLTANEMISEIARQLGLEHAYNSKMRTLNELRDLLLGLHNKGHRALVIVDEGQMLANRPDILQELRILLNFCVEDAFLLTFILSGQKPLEGAIRSMPEFWQRLPVRYFLQNLDSQDTKKLIQHRLRLAGLVEGRELFTDEAHGEIFRVSEGCPRVICSIADLALVIGRSLRIRQIDASEIAQACGDMENSRGGNFHYYHFLNAGQRDATAAAAPAMPPVTSPADPRPDRTVESPAASSPEVNEDARTVDAVAEESAALEEMVFTEGSREGPIDDSETSDEVSSEREMRRGIPTALAPRNAERLLQAYAQRAGLSTSRLAPRNLERIEDERLILVIPRRRSVFGRSTRLDVFDSEPTKNLLCTLAITDRALALVTPGATYRVSLDEPLRIYTTRTERMTPAILILETSDRRVYRIHLNDIGRADPELIEALLRYIRARQRDPVRDLVPA